MHRKFQFNNVDSNRDIDVNKSKQMCFKFTIFWSIKVRHNYILLNSDKIYPFRIPIQLYHTCKCLCTCLKCNALLVECFIYCDNRPCVTEILTSGPVGRF